MSPKVMKSSYRIRELLFCQVGSYYCMTWNCSSGAIL